MGFYLALLVVVVAAGIPLQGGVIFKSARARVASKFAYCAVAGVVLFIVEAVRKSVGYDYNLYATWFNKNIMYRPYEEIMSWSREKGFAVPLKIMTSATSDYQAMFVLVAFVIIAAVVVYIFKHSSIPFVSVAAFMCSGLFFVTMNFMRQSISALICAFAVFYIHKNMPVRFLILVLFASCFHYSALIFIPFYFILKIKMNWAVLGVYAAGSVVLFLNSFEIIKAVTKYFYSAYDPSSSVHMTTGLNWFYTIMVGTVFIVAFLLRKRLIARSSLNSILINCLFFATFSEFIGIKHSILSRFMMPFEFPAMLILTPEIVIVLGELLREKLPQSRRRVAVAAAYAVLVCAGAGSYSYLLSINSNGVLPYKTVYDELREWQEEHPDEPPPVKVVVPDVTVFAGWAEFYDDDEETSSGAENNVTENETFSDKPVTTIVEGVIPDGTEAAEAASQGGDGQ